MAEPAASARLEPVRDGVACSAVSTFQRQAIEAAQDITFGSVAGIAGKIIEYPFDTVKVRLQSQPATRPLRYAGPLDCFRQGWRAGGLRDLYRGVSAPMVGAAVETGSLFLSYRLVQRGAHRLLHGDDPRPLSVAALAACGAAAGGITSLFLTPIELVKCQMQAPQGQALRSPLAVIAEVFRHHGARGFWRGQLGTLIRETGGSAAWFGAYEAVCALFKHQRRRRRSPDALVAPEPAPASVAAAGNAALPLWQQLLAGAAAGVGYNFLFFPADTVKSRMQTEAVGPGGGRRPTFAAVGAALWRQRGLRGMYQGCGITVARSAPSSAFIFVIYEGLKASFG